MERGRKGLAVPKRITKGYCLPSATPYPVPRKSFLRSSNQDCETIRRECADIPRGHGRVWHYYLRKPQGFTPNRDHDRNREDVIERIVQKALAPIVEKLQKITERDERPTHTSYRRPNYNNDIRGQNTWNRNNNVN